MGAAFDTAPRPPGDLNHLCGLTVAVQMGTKKTKHYCKCRGVSEGKFILLQQPPSATARSQLMTTNSIILRYMYNGTVWGFKTRIIKVVETPFHLVFLDFPNTIERHSLRACERADVVIQSEFSFSGLVFKAVIRDLSCGGCRLVISPKDSGNLPLAEMGKSGFLTFLTDVSEKPITVVCKVVRTVTDKERTELGLAFDDSDLKTMHKIERFVDRVMDILA